MYKTLRRRLQDTGSAALLDLEVGLLLIRVTARRGVNHFLPVVVISAASLGRHVDLVAELELIGVLDDVGSNALGRADVAAGDVVCVLVETAGAVDWGGDGWVVLGAVWCGYVERIVAA